MVEVINQRFEGLPDWVKWALIPFYFVLGTAIVALYPFYLILAAIINVIKPSTKRGAI